MGTPYPDESESTVHLEGRTIRDQDWDAIHRLAADSPDPGANTDKDPPRPKRHPPLQFLSSLKHAVVNAPRYSHLTLRMFARIGQDDSHRRAIFSTFLLLVALAVIVAMSAYVGTLISGAILSGL